MKNLKIIILSIIAAIALLLGYQTYLQQQKNMVIQAPCLPGYIISDTDTCVKA